MERRKAILLIYALSWAGIAGLIMAIGAAPLLSARSPRWSSFLYTLFAPFCHQNPDRCFLLAGRPLAVCARCLGVYLGFAAGLLLYPLARGFQKVRPPSLPLFLAVSAPSAADVAGNVLGLWSSSSWLRFGLAAVWGTLLPFFFIPGLVEAVSRPRPESGEFRSRD